MSELTNVTTGKVRLSYVHLFKTFAQQAGQEEKYSCTVLVPKSDMDTMGRINAAIEAAKQKGIAEKWNGQCPPIVPTPVYDGDGVRPSDGMPFGPECKGHWVFTAGAKADNPPEVVDKMGNPIINQSQIYSGIYGRVNVNFYAYSFGGKKGIGCGYGLGPVQKLEDGEPLSSSTISAAAAFGAAPQPTAPTYQSAPAGYQQAAPAYQQTPMGYQQPGAMYQQAPAQQSGAINPITGLPY